MASVTSTARSDRLPSGHDQVCRGRPRSIEADEAILEATLVILADEGYGALTMAGVAHRAGVSTATLYRRWASKEDLVVGALEHMSDQDTPGVPDTGTLRGDLTELLLRMTELMTARSGRVIEGLLSETLRNKQLADTVRSRFTHSRLDALGTILERATDRGEIEPVADRSVALSLITGPLQQRLFISGEPVNRRVVKQLVDLLTRAFGAE